jgi:hypothetical protein
MSEIVIYIDVNLLATKTLRESVGKFERKMAFQDGWHARQPRALGSRTRKLRSSGLSPPDSQ